MIMVVFQESGSICYLKKFLTHTMVFLNIQPCMIIYFFKFHAIVFGLKRVYTGTKKSCFYVRKKIRSAFFLLSMPF